MSCKVFIDKNDVTESSLECQTVSVSSMFQVWILIKLFEFHYFRRNTFIS